MPRTTFALVICILLGCLLLAARAIPGPGGDEPASQTAAVRRLPPITEMAPVSDSVAAAPSADDAAVQPEGPILLPLNPPYLNKPIQDELPAQMIGPATEEALQDVEETEETTPEEEVAQQPAEPATEETASDEAPQTTQPEAPASPEPEPRRELTPTQAALRDRVRRTLAFHRRQALSARENTATELMHACLAFGCGTEVYRSDAPARKINGITCLCWNYPCAGYEPLVLCEGRMAARIGYGCQEHRSQLLAVLALSRVQATYPIRVGEDIRTVADLVESEKLGCRSGTDLSLTLIGLTYYLVDDPTWKNSLGEDWSIQRIVKEELAQPVATAVNGGTYRLMGLSYALYWRAKRKQPIDGQFRRAQKFIDDFYDYAFELQNSDGSWSPRFFAAKGTSRDQAAQLRSTGHILEWLAMSLPEDRLDDPRVVRSVEHVNRLLSSGRYRNSVKSLSTREIGSVMHALHALAVYDERFFKPTDPRQPAPEAIKQAAR